MLSRVKGFDRTCLSSEQCKSTATIHQGKEKIANVQGFAFNQNNYFWSLRKNTLRSLSFTWIPLLSTNPIKFQIAKYMSNLSQIFDF